MELIFVVLTLTLGFVTISYLNNQLSVKYQQHIEKLELLIKAENLVDYKHYSKDEDTHTKLEDSIPETLTEIFDGKSPEEIREAFK